MIQLIERKQMRHLMLTAETKMLIVIAQLTSFIMRRSDWSKPLLKVSMSRSYALRIKLTDVTSKKT